MEAQGIVGPGPAKLNLINPSQRIAGSFTFTSSSTASLGFDVRGISYYRLLWVPQGTVTSCNLSLDSGNSIDPTLGTIIGPLIGGITMPPNLPALGPLDCSTAGYYVTTFPARISLYAQITPTITGSGSVTVVLIGYSESPWPH
jgi:hypothetical protein